MADIIGTNGNDNLVGTSGDDVIDGLAGADVMAGGDGNDTYLFGRGAGQDIVNDYDVTGFDMNTIRMAADVSPSEVVAQANPSGDLVLEIVGGSDDLTLQSFFVDPSYQAFQIAFADGTIWNSSTLLSIATGVTLTGTDGPDSLHGTVLSDSLVGGGGDDSLYGGPSGRDVLVGGAGNDMLFAGDGPTTLDGGTGNDFLQSGSGDATFVFGPGYGQDTIQVARAFGANSIDTIELLPGIALSDVTLQTNVGGDLLLSFAGTSDRLTVLSNFSDRSFQVNQIAFADGTIWDETAILGQTPGLVLTDTIGGVYLQGSPLGDTISGLGGNDTLDGGAGDDLLMGGPGDLLLGGAGNDTYSFARGDGSETISESDFSGQEVNTIRMAENIAPADVTLRTDANGDLLLGLMGTTDQLTVQYHFFGPQYQIDQVTFADGTTWNASILLSQTPGLVLTDATGGMYLQGSPLGDTLSGVGGDTLAGGAGNDTYLYARGNGQVTIYEENASGQDVNTIHMAEDIAPADMTLQTDGNGDLLLGISGTSDQLTVANYFADPFYQVGQVTFVDGTIWNASTLLSQTPGLVLMDPAGGQFLRGSPLADTLSGTGGNNTLAGGAGNDTYQFTWGDGTNTIFDTALPGEGNVLQFGPNTTLNDLILSYSGGFLQIEVGSWGAKNDMVRLSGFDPNNAYGAHAVDTFQFGDGSSMSYAQLMDFGFDFGGTAGDDTITGTSAVDFFNGGTGNDTLIGGAGNDTYTFLQGDGQDTIIDNDSTPGNNDSLNLDTANPLDLVFSQQANDLRIAVSGSTDQVTVQDWYLGASHQIETIQAGNGQTLQNTQVDQLIQAMASFSQQTGLTWEEGIAQQPQQVQTVLAANWQGM